VICSTFIVCNENLYQQRPLTENKIRQILQIINETKIVVTVQHQAHHTQTTLVPVKKVSWEPNERERWAGRS